MTRRFNGRNDNERKAFYGSILEEFKSYPEVSLNDTKKAHVDAVEINSQHQRKKILIVSRGHPLWSDVGRPKG